MITLRNSIKVFFLIFLILENLSHSVSSKPHVRLDLEEIMTRYDLDYKEYSVYNPREYANTLEDWVKKNRYDKAKKIYFKKRKMLSSVIVKGLSDDNHTEYWKALHQYIFLQREMYKYAGNFTFYSSDTYDPKIVFISTLLSAAYYFSKLNINHYNELFEKAKIHFKQELITYNENLIRWKTTEFPFLYKINIEETEEDRKRLVKKFTDFFSSNQTEVSLIDTKLFLTLFQDITNPYEE